VLSRAGLLRAGRHGRARVRHEGGSHRLRDEVLLADIDLSENEASIARRQFLRERRPEVYGAVVEPTG